MPGVMRTSPSPPFKYGLKIRKSVRIFVFKAFQTGEMLIWNRKTTWLNSLEKSYKCSKWTQLSKIYSIYMFHRFCDPDKIVNVNAFTQLEWRTVEKMLQFNRNKWAKINLPWIGQNNWAKILKHTAQTIQKPHKRTNQTLTLFMQ